MTLNTFIARGQSYSFPTRTGDQEFSTNFKELATRYATMPGMDGGLDMYGTDRAPTGKGRIQVKVYLVSPTRAGMQTLRDSLNKMADWGAGVLYDTPTGLSQRWCYCRVAKINIPEDRHKHSDLHQSVDITFETDDPYWYKMGSGSAVWGAFTWGGGAKWGSASAPTSVTTSGTISIFYSGSALTYPQIYILNDSGSSANDIIIRRKYSGAVEDEVRYTGVMANNDWLDIRCMPKVVKKNSVADYANFTALNSHWMRLLPGWNYLDVTVNGTIKVHVGYMERYT